MRGKVIAALAAALLTVTAGVIAQTSGFPSRPRFGAVGIGTAPGTTAQLRIAGSASEKARFISADSAGDNYLAFYDANGTTRRAYIGNGGTSDNTFHINNDAAGADISIVTSGGGAVVVNGAPVMTGREAYAAMYGDSGTACVLAAGFSAKNAAGCVRVSSVAGRYQLNFATAFASVPVCAVAVDRPAASDTIAYIQAISVAMVTVQVYRIGTTSVVDNVAHVRCSGS